MDELDPEKIFNKIIYKELEPNVLNEEIVKKAVYEQGPQIEAGRLFRLEELSYEHVTVLRLEFQNILKIDNLWMLKQLKVLSLAFNKIDKIENLESLTNLRELNMSNNLLEKLENLELKNLEVLTVFGNQISKIENIDSLQSLEILSAGNNQIDSKDGMERLRFLKNLRSLNLRGNSIEDGDKNFRLYIAGLLPGLKYYEYIYITKEERNEGRDFYRFALRELMETEKIEINEREKIAKEKDDEVHLSACFVEHLNNHQLFESFFEDDLSGKALLSIGKEANELLNQFRDEAFCPTQNIYAIGLSEYKKREKEIQNFRKCMTKGRLETQLQGQKQVKAFLEFCKDIFNRAQICVNKYKVDREREVVSGGVVDCKQVDKDLQEHSDEFIKLYETTWQNLMEDEVQLHESVFDANANFELVIQEMMNKFIEKSQAQFVQLRDSENNFIDALIDAVQIFVTIHAACGEEDKIPLKLKESVNNKDIVYKLGSSSRSVHMQKIDKREDKLVTRSRDFVRDLCANFQNDEINRNRTKIMEINYFLDTQREQFDLINAQVLNIEIQPTVFE